MSAVRRRTANDLLCGAITAPLLEYSVVILVHGVSYQNLTQLQSQDSKLSVQIARLNEELPLLKTKTIPLEKCIFEEVLVVHAETLEELELLLCTSDEVIDEYDLKLADRDTFEYYHITLAGQHSELFITLVIKTKHIQPSPPALLDIQVLVQYLENPLDRPREAVVIVGKDHFESSYSQISFNAHDKVQMSTPQGPSDQPQWYHTFLFRGCSVNQHIGLYLFHQPYISRDNPQWVLGDKVGECTITLEEKLVNLLTSKEEGVCFTNLPLLSVQATLFLRISLKIGVSPPLTPNNIPATTLDWGAIGELEVPVKPGSVTDQQSSPGRQGVPSETSLAEPASWVKDKADKDSLVLPDHSAILQLLQRHSTPQLQPQAETTLRYDNSKDNSAEYMSKIIEEQASELRRYREAVQKMGKDIVSCKDYIMGLKKDNTQLRSTVGTLQQPVHDVSLINVPRDDLIKEVLRSRRALREEIENNREVTQSLSTLKKKFASFEKERREIAELRNAHTAQNQLLQKLQDKVKVTRVLEKTCRDQEKVIEQLEGILRGPSIGHKHVTFDNRLALPPPTVDNVRAVPKLEPINPGNVSESNSFENVPAETSLKLTVRSLENQLRFAQEAYQDEMSNLAADKMDLQLQLARLRR